MYTGEPQPVDSGSGGIGFIWIYGLIVVFITGIIEIIIMPALKKYLVPILLNFARDNMPNASAELYETQVAHVLTFMHMMPYVIMFVILVYLVVSIFKREQYDYYQ
jgi:hypothetical protein